MRLLPAMTGMTALARSHAGAVAMFFPVWTFEPSSEKYSERAFKSTDWPAASVERERVGAAEAAAHSAEATKMLRSILRGGGN